MTAAWPYPAPAQDGAARHLVAGLELPDIELPATHGGSLNLRRLTGSQIVFVYPWTGRPGLASPPGWDDIPGAHGSTPEAEGFRDHYDAFRALGFGVLGLSGQDTAHQGEFAARMRLPFALLSDADAALRSAVSLPTFMAGETIYLKRLTLMLRDGHIERVVYPVHPPHTHAQDLLGELSGSSARP